MCSFLNIHIYLFIWLCWVLVPAQGIFSCSMWTLSWGTWALTRDLTWALELGVQGLNCCTTGGGGGGRVSTCFNYFNVPHSLHSYCDILSLPIQPYWETSMFPSCMCWTPTLGLRLWLWMMRIHKRTTNALLCIHWDGWNQLHSL